MDRKYIILLILPRCFTAPLHDQDCVTYPFEEEFDVQFSSLYSECPEKWKLGNYNSTLLKSPHVLSRTFISPTNLLSCVISYKFPMTATGIVEVNLYMDTVSTHDFISIEVHSAVKDSNTVVGEKTISSLSADFETGWKTVEIQLSGSGTFMGYILLKGKMTDGSIVLIDSFRYIPPEYDKELCKIYDHPIYDYTEFYDLTTLANSTDIQTITEEPSHITEGHSDEIKNTAYTHPDIAMNMLDSTTEFIDTPEQSMNIQTTQEASDVTEVVHIIDRYTNTSRSTIMLTTEFPSTTQSILSTETSTHETDTEWFDSKLLNTTVEESKIEDEINASTLLVTTVSNYVTHSSPKQDQKTTTSFPEILNDLITNRDITTSFKTIYTKMPDTHDGNITSKANVMDTELTTKLTPTTLEEESNIKTTTTEYIDNSTTLWDFIHTSTISRTKGSEFKDTSEISSTNQYVIKNSTVKDDIVMPLKGNETIDKTDKKTIDIYTTSPTEVDDVTFARTLKEERTHSTTELEVLVKNEPVTSNTPGVQNKNTLQTDLQPQTTTEIPEYAIMDNEFLANFSIYSIVSLFIIVLILIIATFLKFYKNIKVNLN